MFENSTGRRINQEDFLKKMNTEKERIKVLENGKWFLCGFISFQYCGRLNTNNNFNRSVLETFRKNITCENTSTYLFEVCETSKRPLREVNKEQETKNEEQDKEKRVKGKKENKFIPPSFEEFEKYCSDNKHKNIAVRAFSGYSEAIPPWTDSQGHLVRSWKQKLQNVWFREENRDPLSEEEERKMIEERQRIKREKGLL
jgi:hypothetical protein